MKLPKNCLYCKYCNIKNKHGRPILYCRLLSKNKYFYLPLAGNIPSVCPIKTKRLTKFLKGREI